MKINFKLFFITVSFCSFLISNLAVAQNAFIVDQLLVGLHQEKDTGSPIIKVLSTGTEVELVLREGDYAQIREKEEGKIGWIDASYLMYDRPAKLLLAELQEKVKTLESQDGAQTILAAQAEHDQKAAELNKNIDDLKQNLSSEKLKAGEFEATISQHEKKIAQMEANISDNKNNNNDDQIKGLEETISDLETKLETANKENVDQISQAKITSDTSMMKILDLFKNRTIQIVLGVLALTAFFYGRRWEDQKIRKRHGGFRV